MISNKLSLLLYRIICGNGKKQAADFPKNQSLIRLLQKQASATPKEKPQTKGNECEQHKKKYEIVCLDCKKRLCSKCALFGGHRSHDLRQEEDVISEIAMRKECLSEMLQLVADNEQIFAKHEEVKVAYEKCTEREKEIHTLIELKFQDYFEALKNKKAKVMQSLANVVLSIGEKFSGFKEIPQKLEDKVTKWKNEY